MVHEKELKQWFQQQSKQQILSHPNIKIDSYTEDRRLKMNKTPTILSLNINLTNSKEKYRIWIIDQRIFLQQVPFQEYHQRMDRYQRNQRQNFVEHLLPNHQDLYLPLPNIMTKNTQIPIEFIGFPVTWNAPLKKSNRRKSR